MAKTPAAMVVDEDIQARFEMRQVVKASGLTLAGECGYGMQALSAAGELRPDIVVIGVNEPMERPLQTVESLVALLPDTPIIVYSESRDLEAARKAMLAGARDFLPRPLRPEVLRTSVLKAMEAEENRRLRASGHAPGAPARATVVTVFGAKGGIGKSTIATNLAVALAKQGRTSVVLVDLDNGFGDVAGMLDLKSEHTLLDLVRNVEKVDRDDLRRYVQRHEASGLDVLPAPGVLDWRTINADDVRRVVDLLATSYDTIVLDTAGVLNDLSEMAVEAATIILWVTTTEFASVRDSIEAMRALNVLSYSPERVRIVVNSLAPEDGIRPSAVRDALQREIFWSIPYDRKMRTGTHLGQPIVLSSPQSPAARNLADLAHLIAGGRLDQNRKILGPFKWRPGVTQQPVAESN